MKVLKIVIIGLVLVFAGELQAQVSVNVNIGSPPMWGPVGYSNVQYYYLPDVNSYYDVRSSMFIYQSNGVWIHRSYLPSRYRNYDLYGGRKVVMNGYHGNTPYTYYKEHKNKYAQGYHGPAQKNIGSKPGKIYSNGNGNGNSKGHGDGKNSNHGNNHSEDHGKKK